MLSDFNPYRYLASEGFLPGYSFPRLPLAAYIPTSARRFGDGDYLQRPRFLAIREFGPGALIYHEGARYQVDRIQLPAGGTGDLVTSSAKRCEACGYLGADGEDRCDMCREMLPSVRSVCCSCTPSTPRSGNGSPPTRRNGGGRASGSSPPIGSTTTARGPAAATASSSTKIAGSPP